MVLDFDMTCVIKAWGSPQVEGKQGILKWKLSLLFSQDGRVVS